MPHSLNQNQNTPKQEKALVLLISMMPLLVSVAGCAPPQVMEETSAKGALSKDRMARLTAGVAHYKPVPVEYTDCELEPWVFGNTGRKEVFKCTALATRSEIWEGLELIEGQPLPGPYKQVNAIVLERFESPRGVKTFWDRFTGRADDHVFPAMVAYGFNALGSSGFESQVLITGTIGPEYQGESVRSVLDTAQPEQMLMTDLHPESHLPTATSVPVRLKGHVLVFHPLALSGRMPSITVDGRTPWYDPDDLEVKPESAVFPAVALLPLGVEALGGALTTYLLGSVGEATLSSQTPASLALPTDPWVLIGVTKDDVLSPDFWREPLDVTIENGLYDDHNWYNNGFGESRCSQGATAVRADCDKLHEEGHLSYLLGGSDPGLPLAQRLNSHGQHPYCLSVAKGFYEGCRFTASITRLRGPMNAKANAAPIACVAGAISCLATATFPKILDMCAGPAFLQYQSGLITIGSCTQGSETCRKATGYWTD